MNKTIYSQIQAYFDTGIIPQGWDIVVDNTTVLQNVDVLYYLQYMYGEYKTVHDLSLLWFNYQMLHKPDFEKAYNAWTTEYAPLDNYNGTETYIHQRMDGEQTETIEHGKTVTNAIQGDGLHSKTSVSTFDSENQRDDTETISTGTTKSTDGGTTTTTTDTNTKSLTVDGTTYTADYVESETRKRHGNLGVTTSQQMITSEVEMRLNPLVKLYIDTFVSEYAYYVTEGC